MERNILRKSSKFFHWHHCIKFVSSVYFPFPPASCKSLSGEDGEAVMKSTRGKSRDQKERKSDIGKKKEKCANVETDIKKMTTERMKLKNSDSQISRKRKRANSEMEETPPKDFDLKDLSKKHILQCISAIFHLTEEQLKENNLLATEMQPIFMQVTCVKIPKVPRRQMRM